MSKKNIYKEFWKAHDCQYCLHFAGIIKGCKLGEENCFLEKKQKTKKSVCDGCSYGKVAPCIGSCAVINIVEMRIKQEAASARSR